MIKLKDILKEEMLVESPVTVIKPPFKKPFGKSGKRVTYGHINFRFYFTDLAKAADGLYNILRKVDIISTDFEDRVDDLKTLSTLGSWRETEIKKPLLTSLKNLDKLLKNPKNFKEPDRVYRALPGGKNFPKLVTPYVKKLISNGKNLEKFNNQKISKLFPQSKGTKVGDRRVGEFGGDSFLEPILDLINNKGNYKLITGFNDITDDMKYKAKKTSNSKVMVQGIERD
jgi:hypothetical protein